MERSGYKQMISDIENADKQKYAQGHKRELYVCRRRRETAQEDGGGILFLNVKADTGLPGRILKCAT